MNSGAVAEVAKIEKSGVLHVAGVSNRRHNSTALERGEYVPDEAHIEVCLKCTRKKCSGKCKLVEGRMTKV